MIFQQNVQPHRRHSTLLRGAEMAETTEISAISLPAPQPAPKLFGTHLGRRKRELLVAFAMLAPSLLGVGIFLLLPLIAVFALSFTRWNLVGQLQFVGFANFSALATDASTWSSLGVTALFALFAVPATLVCGLLIALALNSRIPGSRIASFLFVLPWAAAPLALGVIWQWLLTPSGVLSNPHTALPAMAGIYVWQNAGYVALFFLAGIRTIPSSIMAAATLDGAGAIRRFFSITLPLLRPTTFFVGATSLITAVQVFDLAYGLTGGSPGYPAGSTDLFAAHIYTTAFVSPRIGTAAAMAVMMAVAVLALSAAQWLYFSKYTTFELGVEL